MNNETSGKRFLSGVTALTLSTVIVKVIGLVYKIPMMHVLGAEGMGYFNSAYELYTLFFVMATAGLPVAVSILISESLAAGRLRNVKKLYRISFVLFFVIGLAGALVMSVFARRLAAFVGSPEADRCILLIAPTVFFVSVASAIRGYFQGNQNMIPTSVSQVLEAIGKMTLGILLGVWAVRAGYSSAYAAAFAVVGLVAGSAVSMLYLLISKARDHTRLGSFSTDLSTDSTRRILARLVILAIPVTVSASLSGLTRVVDMTLMIRRLSDIGFETSTATAMFGSYSTLAVPIYHLPSSLVVGIAVTLVPSLTEAVEREDRERELRLIGTSFRLCAVLAIPCAMGISVFSRPILELLFHGQDEAISVSAPLLSALGLSVVSSCLMGVTNSVLQAHRRVVYPIASMAVGTLVKIVAAYILLGIPEIGIMGAPLSTLLCNTVSVAMNLWFIEKCRAVSGHLYGTLFRPFGASLMAIFVSLGIYLPLSARVSTAVSFLIAAVACVACYLPLASAFGALQAEDVALLPMGDRIAKTLQTHLKFSEQKKKGKSNGKQTGDQRAAEKRKILF